MRINYRLVGIGLLLIALGLSSMPLTGVKALSPASASLYPTSLALSPIPPKLPADNNTYPAMVVSILDAGGAPTVALAAINVSLTSAVESVGKVVSSVVIPAGSTYAVANFTTTHTPGETTITAATTGLATATTTVTTVIAVGYPTHLVITAVPNSVPASAASTGTLILQLEDDTGLPAKAINDVPISLYSSNTNVVNVTAATATMNQGEYLQEINYTSGFVPGSATITASAPGFSSGTVQISVLGSPPLALRLVAQPAIMVACTSNVTSCQGRLVVALTDPDGNPTLATRDIQVQIRSSDLAVVDANETATIKEGTISVIANFTVTATSVSSDLGSELATVTASSPGLQSSFATITIDNPNFVSPSLCTSGGSSLCSLVISAGPNPVLANHVSYSSVVVSLEATSTTGGTAPAVNDTGPTEVTLTSSVTGVGNFTDIKFVIPKGRNWAAVGFTSTYQVGTTALTASAQNILPVQTSLETYGPVPSQVVVSAISTQLPADGASHPALELSLEDAFGSPAVAATNIPVSMASSQGDIVSVDSAVIPAGQTFAILNVTTGILQGTANVTALVSSFTSGYASSSVDLSTVIPAPSALSALAPDGDAVMFTSSTQGQLPVLSVQLQDSGGNPARAREPMNITITSSNSTVISKVLTAVIGVGQDYASIPLAAKVPGRTTLTISTPGLSTASIGIDFLSYPNSETISGGPLKIFTNQTSVLSVNVLLDGTPLVGAPVNWKASDGGLTVATVHTNSTATSTTATTTSSATKAKSTTTAVAIRAEPLANDTTDKSGTSTVVFHPTAPGSAVITAVVAPGGFLAKTLNLTVQVSAPPAPKVAVKAKPTLVQQLTTFPMVLVPVGGAGGAVAAVLVIRKRRGGGGTGDEDFDTSFE